MQRKTILLAEPSVEAAAKRAQKITDKQERLGVIMKCSTKRSAAKPLAGVQKLSRQEQETVIRTSAANKFWDVWTCDPKFIRRFAKAGYESRVEQHGTAITVPLNGLSIRSAKSLKPSRRLLDHLHQVNQPATEAPTTSESSTGLEKSRLKIVGE